MWKVDSSVERFARGEDRATLRTMPVPQWVDGPFEYVHNLSKGTVRCQTDLVRESVLAQVAGGAAASDAVDAANGNVCEAGALQAKARSAAKRAKDKRHRANKRARLAGTDPRC